MFQRNVRLPDGKIKMNGSLLTNVLCVVALCSASACSTINTKVDNVVLERLAKDMARTVELAEKYNSPEVVQCAKFLQVAIADTRGLSAEPTEGLFSTIFKAAVLRRMGTHFEDAFATECGGVAARMLLELGRRAPIPGIGN